MELALSHFRREKKEGFYNPFTTAPTLFGRDKSLGISVESILQWEKELKPPLWDSASSFKRENSPKQIDYYTVVPAKKSSPACWGRG